MSKEGTDKADQIAQRRFEPLVDWQRGAPNDLVGKPDENSWRLRERD